LEELLLGGGGGTLVARIGGSGIDVGGGGGDFVVGGGGGDFIVGGGGGGGGRVEELLAREKPGITCGGARVGCSVRVTLVVAVTVDVINVGAWVKMDTVP
jgi:hypothetical protein